MDSSKSSTESPIVLVVRQEWPEDVINDILERRCSLKKIRNSLSLSINGESVCHSSHGLYRVLNKMSPHSL